MKNLSSILLISIISLLIFSCEKKNQEVNINAQEIISHFNAGKFNHQKGKLLDGKVKVRSTANDEIAIILENQIPSLTYVLQTKNPPTESLNIDIESAQVIFLRSDLFVLDKDKNETYLFGWNDEEAIKHFKDLAINTKFKGYGLAEYVGDNNVINK